MGLDDQSPPKMDERLARLLNRQQNAGDETSRSQSKLQSYEALFGAPSTQEGFMMDLPKGKSSRFSLPISAPIDAQQPTAMAPSPVASVPSAPCPSRRQFVEALYAEGTI